MHDCYYVENLTFMMDVKIVFKTIASVLLSKNINVEESLNNKDKPAEKEKVGADK